MTQWTIHTQFDSDPRRNGKLRLLRRETAEGESHVIASNVKPDIAPLLAAAPDLLAALENLAVLFNCIDQSGATNKAAYNKAIAAIAKAKGIE